MTRLGMAIGVSAALLFPTACTSADYGDSRNMDGGYPNLAAPDQPVFTDYGVNPEVDTSEDNQSTFALDVDTGSYTITRGYLRDGFLPESAAVRTEEFVNYFDQDYPPPASGMSIHLDGGPLPFPPAGDKRVLRVGLQGAVVNDADRAPANLTFIVDVSGSMRGYNMEMVRSGLERLLDSLRPDDAVAIATFDTEARLLLEMTPMTAHRQIRDAVAQLHPVGYTNLEAGLRVGYDHARSQLRGDGINRVILLSDGEANVGEDDPAVLAEQIAKQAGDTTLAVIGVGRQTYNDVVLEQFANQGNGFYAYIDTIREAERLFVHDLTGTLQAVALDAKVQVTFNPAAVSRFRLLGYENRQLNHEDLRNDNVDGGLIGAGHAVTALYEITVPEGGLVSAELATVELRWRDPATGEPVEAEASITVADLVDSFDQAAPRLRQDVLVAAFAENLREAPWGELITLRQIADNAQVLTRALPGDQRWVEFVELAGVAADLNG